MPSDAAALAGFLSECAIALSHPAKGATPNPAWVREVLFSNPSICRILIAERDGQPVGFVSWRPAYDYLFGVCGAEIVWLFVQPAHRMLGVAAALLSHACADVSAEGGQFLWGTYTEPTLGKFYERMANVSLCQTWCGVPSMSPESAVDWASCSNYAPMLNQEELSSD
jgi:GNAT superfamily N-acetyltransferase